MCVRTGEVFEGIGYGCFLCAQWRLWCAFRERGDEKFFDGFRGDVISYVPMSLLGSEEWGTHGLYWCFLCSLVGFRVRLFFLLGFRIRRVVYFWIILTDWYERYGFLLDTYFFFWLILRGVSPAEGNCSPSLSFLFCRTGGSSLEEQAFWREGSWEAVFCG